MGLSLHPDSSILHSESKHQKTLSNIMKDYHLTLRLLEPGSIL